MSDDQTTTVPPTEPTATPDAAPAPKRTRKPRAKPATNAQKLVPDFDKLPHGVNAGMWYWVGVLNDAPKGQIDVAGVDFPKMEEIVSKGPDGKTQRAPVAGGLRQLTKDKVEAICEALPRTIIRFYSGAKEEAGTGQNMGDDYVRPRSGQLITIPSEKQMTEMRENGKSWSPYSKHKNDEPAACYMYAQLCDDQQNPVRGSVLPDTLDKTGLSYPEE